MDLLRAVLLMCLCWCVYGASKCPSSDQIEAEGSYCFVYGTEPMSKPDAVKFCRSKGGLLASVRNKQDQDYINDILDKREDKHKEAYPWMPISINEEGTFSWDDGGTSDYANFRASMVNSLGESYKKGYKCIYMELTKGHFWSTWKCDHALNVALCMIPKKGAVTTPKPTGPTWTTPPAEPVEVKIVPSSAPVPKVDPEVQACLDKCPDGGSVVCATFEKEYRNLCVANCHKATIQNYDSCSKWNGSPTTIDQCKKLCPQNEDTVCTDGNDQHPNVCFAMCNQGTIKCFSPCSTCKTAWKPLANACTKKCPPGGMPVCTPKMRQYPNLCIALCYGEEILTYDRCVKWTGVETRYDKCKRNCPQSEATVCTDGWHQHPNICFLNCHGAEVKCRGECSKCKNFQPELANLWL